MIVIILICIIRFADDIALQADNEKGMEKYPE